MVVCGGSVIIGVCVVMYVGCIYGGHMYMWP